jgi:hypothetical protein
MRVPLGGLPAAAVHSEGGLPVGSGGDNAELDVSPDPGEDLADCGASDVPLRQGRHAEHRIVPQQRDEAVEIVVFPRARIAFDQGTLLAVRLRRDDTIADVNVSGLWPGKVVTEVAPAGPFWEAEPEHQDYLERYPNGYTCHFLRPNWILPHRAVAV